MQACWRRTRRSTCQDRAWASQGRATPSSRPGWATRRCPHRGLAPPSTSWQPTHRHAAEDLEAHASSLGDLLRHLARNLHQTRLSPRLRTGWAPRRGRPGRLPLNPRRRPARRCRPHLVERAGKSPFSGRPWADLLMPHVGLNPPGLRSGLGRGAPRLQEGRGGPWGGAPIEGWRHFQPAL